MLLLWQMNVYMIFCVNGSKYRSKGVGSYLVTMLKNKIIEMGDIPFYGTGAANIHSQNIAVKSGFKPAWVETEAVKIGESN